MPHDLTKLNWWESKITPFHDSTGMKVLGRFECKEAAFIWSEHRPDGRSEMRYKLRLIISDGNKSDLTIYGDLAGTRRLFLQEVENFLKGE